MMDLLKGALPIRVVVGLLVGAIAAYAAVDKAIDLKIEQYNKANEKWQDRHIQSIHEGVMIEADKDEILRAINDLQDLVKDNREASHRLARAVVVLVNREGVDLRSAGLD